MSKEDMALPSDRAGGADAPEPRAASQPEALIPSAGARILAGLTEALEVETLRQRFVHDFQYRFHAYSDHYSVVAMFAQAVARESVASAIEARRAETQRGSVHESAGPQGDAQEPNTAPGTGG